MLTKLEFVLFVSFGVLVCFLHYSAAVICDLKPREAVGQPSHVGTRYRIVLANNPEKYVPGQTYTGKNSVVADPNKFNGFALTVEPSDRNEDVAAMGPLAAGVFKLLPHDKYTKIDEFCPNTVVHTSLSFVNSIEVFWSAPNPGIGCVRFRASIMEQHIWYRNGGGLSLELCEQEAFENNIREKCCSCNEAKYEMKFEGLWTRQSHPHLYPDNSWLTRFSDVIGASHAYDYRFWKVNESASPGLIEFSEKEVTILLESEIKSNKTRTVIKAKGLSHPNITEKTFAVFRVDQEHHLLSLISIIRPSPDWFVGISGLSLCDDKCRWTPQKTIDLYPYDLGLYADLKYESKSIPKEEPIHKIDHTNIAESPFYINTEEKLKPLARVYLTKAREYEKECENSPAEDNQTPNGEGPLVINNHLHNLDEPVLVTVPPRVSDIIETSTNSRGFVRPPSTEESEYEMEKRCEEAPYKIRSTKCSVPECDLERVYIVYRQFDEKIRDYCMRLNIQMEKLERCDKNCSGGKQPPSRIALAKCTATEFPNTFSTCDPSRCIRNRTRTASDPSKKNDRECLQINWSQEIECQPQDCPRSTACFSNHQNVGTLTWNKTLERKQWRRKPLTRKYNVTISASYTYIAQHKSASCTTNATNSNAG